MSVSTTTTIKAQLSSALGEHEEKYWETFRLFLYGQLSRIEFEDTIKESLHTPQLVLLHNALVVSLFDTSNNITPPQTQDERVVKPPRKKRRLLPYQGPEDDVTSLRSERLKHWTVGMGKRERERVQALAMGMRPADAWMVPPQDEVLQDRGVVLLSERGEPPGSRLALQLSSQTHHAPTLQQLSERINLICAQHNLAAPSRAVATLLMIAFETKLKQLITRAISLTSSSRAISSIRPSSGHRPAVLSTTSLDTLFSLAPAMLPNQSAAAMRLSLGETDTPPEYSPESPRSVLHALLSQRSGYKDTSGGVKTQKAMFI